MGSEEEQIYKIVKLFNGTAELLKSFFDYLPAKLPIGIYKDFCVWAIELLNEAQDCDLGPEINASELKNESVLKKLKLDCDPLLIWGQVMDIIIPVERWINNPFKYYLSENGDILPLDRWEPTKGGFWENFCLALIQNNYPKEDDGESDKLYDVFRHFFIYPSYQFANINMACRDKLLEANINKYPIAGLTLAEYELKDFRYYFLCQETVKGPYTPTGKFKVDRGLWQCYNGQNNIDLGKSPGILRVNLDFFERRGIFKIKCEFTPHHGKAIYWEINYQLQAYEPEDWRAREPLTYIYEYPLFNTWSYDDGFFLGPHKKECTGQAQWHIENADPLELMSEIMVNQILLPLKVNTDYANLAEKVINVVTNGKPHWWPGTVRWSYIKDIDEAIRDIEYACALCEQPITFADLASTKQNQLSKQVITLNGFMNLEQLCKEFNVPDKNKQAFRKRLERFRKKNTFDANAFTESQNKGGQQSKYLYNVKMIASIAEETKGRSASFKRPSKKKTKKY
jgi:hypothetical protein